MAINVGGMCCITISFQYVYISRALSQQIRSNCATMLTYARAGIESMHWRYFVIGSPSVWKSLAWKSLRSITYLCFEPSVFFGALDSWDYGKAQKRFFDRSSVWPRSCCVYFAFSCLPWFFSPWSAFRVSMARIFVVASGLATTTIVLAWITHYHRYAVAVWTRMTGLRPSVTWMTMVPMIPPESLMDSFVHMGKYVWSKTWILLTMYRALMMCFIRFCKWPSLFP